MAKHTINKIIGKKDLPEKKKKKTCNSYPKELVFKPTDPRN